jgi:hypothetical protein
VLASDCARCGVDLLRRFSAARQRTARRGTSNDAIRVTLVVVASLSLVGFAHGATIQVVPGPGTPLQDAIDAASAGDTIKLAGGGYPESIVITKPLRLRGVPGSYGTPRRNRP